MRVVALIAIACVLLHCASDTATRAAESSGMSQEALAGLIHAIDPEATGPPGGLEFTHDRVKMVCVSDATHGRMRIIAPVRAVSDLSGSQVAAVLEANYHSALDARYGTSQGIVYAAFIHPLAPLSPEEVWSAVHQVANLVHTFGSTYSSGELIFNEQGRSL